MFRISKLFVIYKRNGEMRLRARELKARAFVNCNFVALRYKGEKGGE